MQSPAARSASSACPRTRPTPLLDELAGHATDPRFRYRLRYGVGDIVVWDNASLLQAATLTDPDDPRTLWRVTLKERGATAEAVLAATFAQARM